MIGQMESGGDSANTTKAFMADGFTISNGYLPVHFFWMSLNSGGSLLTAYVYFLTSMNSALKLLGSCVYFLTSMNFAKTAHLIRSNSYFTMTSFFFSEIVLFSSIATTNFVRNE